MFEIKREKAGATTFLTVTVSDASVIEAVCAAMSIPTFTRREGLTQVVRCNKREMEIVERRLAALRSAHQTARTVEVPLGSNVVAFSAPSTTWKRRVLHLEYSPVRPAETVLGEGGQVLRFTGWGRSFVCTNELAEPQFHGQAVRYAYYA